MGKRWDRFVPQPVFWKEVLRVLKPGGHVLAFFGSRTYDWGTMAMRIAGFEIRDQIQWIYGSGFPKNLNISKALDELAGAEREVIGKRQHPTLKDKSKIDRQNRQQFHGDNSIKDEWDLTANTTAEAKQWDGWGTALKPAHEPICLARKPLTGTVCETILQWGVGGININACRIPFVNSVDKASATWGRGTNIMGGNFVGSTKPLTDPDGEERINIEANARGRYPSNIIFDEAAAEMLDKQTGILQSGNVAEGGFSGDHTAKIYGSYANNSINPDNVYADKGGASRFFYVAKASQSERNKGLEKHGLRNTHPTVKPIKLMQYLVKMITPPGGHVLDTYNGSGGTGIACKLQGFDYTGMDDDPISIRDSELRIKAYYEPAPTLF